MGTLCLNHRDLFDKICRERLICLDRPRNRQLIRCGTEGGEPVRMGSRLHCNPAELAQGSPHHRTELLIPTKRSLREPAIEQRNWNPSRRAGGRPVRPNFSFNH